MVRTCQGIVVVFVLDLNAMHSSIDRLSKKEINRIVRESLGLAGITYSTENGVCTLEECVQLSLEVNNCE